MRIAVFPVLLVSAALAAPQEVRLNGPLATSLPFAVRGFLASSDGRQAFLLGDLETDGVDELFRVDLAGSGVPVRLNGALVAGGGVGGSGLGSLETSVALSPDGAHIVYLADQEVDQRYELYSVKTTGGPSVKLNGTLVASGAVGLGRTARPFRITPDGHHVLYLADQLQDEVVELFRAPIDGQETPLRLNAPLVQNGRVRDFLPSPNGRWVVYRATRQNGIDLELYLTPVDGSAAARRISGAAVLHGSVGGEPSDYAFSLDSRFIVFRGDLLEDERFELFSTNLDGPPRRIRLNGALVSGGDVARFAPAADPRRVVYLADQRADGRAELFGAPIRSRASEALLNGALVEGGQVLDFALAPRGEGVAYLADQLEAGVVELFGTTLDGSVPPVRLNAPLPPSGSVREIAALTEDGTRVLYLADEEAGTHIGLFSALLLGDGPSLPLERERAVVPGSVAVRPDGLEVLYLAREGRRGIELFAAATDGSAPATRLCQPLASGRQVLAPLRIPNAASTVLYLSDLERAALFELHAAPLDGGSAALQITHTAFGPVAGDVIDAQFTPDASRVVYRADQDVDQEFELYSVPATGGAPERLNAPLVDGGSVGFDPAAFFGDSFQLSPDGTRVVYFARQESSQMELFSVPTDGGAEAVKLNGPLVAGGRVGPANPAPPATFYTITPDGTRVLYLASQLSSARQDLFVVPIDASAPPLLLSTPANSGVWTFALDPQGSRVAFVADPNLRDAWELFSVPISGGLPVRLHPPLGVLRDVKRYSRGSLLFTPDGSRILYQADPTGVVFDDFFPLFSTRSDGSEDPVRLSLASLEVSPGTIADVAAVTANGQRAVFLSDGVYSTPVDGSGPEARLDPAVDPDNPIGFRVHPSLPTVLLQVADTFSIATAPLFSVPEDGSAPALELSPEALGFYVLQIRVFFLEFGAGGTRVVFDTFDELDRSTELHSVLVDGSAPSVRLFDFGGDGFSLSLRTARVSADGQRVLFTTDAPELRVAPIDGSSAAEVLTGPLPPGRTLGSVQPAPTGDRILFRADRDEAGTQELFSIDGSLARHPGRWR